MPELRYTMTFALGMAIEHGDERFMNALEDEPTDETLCNLNNENHRDQLLISLVRRLLPGDVLNMIDIAIYMENCDKLEAARIRQAYYSRYNEVRDWVLEAIANDDKIVIPGWAQNA